MGTGIVKLMGKGDKVTCEKKYTSNTGIEQIIAGWKKRYKSRQYLIIHILPDEGAEQIREVNTQKHHFIPDAPKPTLQRPPAIYSNQRSLYP